MKIVCMDGGIWGSQPLPLPRKCDSFLGPNTSKCEPNGDCQDILTGTLNPKYYVLDVVYAPPGTQGANGGSIKASSVTYTDTSAIGTDVKTDSSFKQGISVTASVSLGWGPLSEQLGGSYGYSKQSGDSNDLAVKTTTGLTLGPIVGSPADGIDHNDDMIWLWLNPVVYVNQTATGGVQWSILQNSNFGGSMDIQYVYAGWLKNPATMDPNVASKLASYGITSADYPNILSMDIYANGVTGRPDATRFVQTSTTFPYERPGPGLPASPPVTLTIVNDTSSSHATTATTTNTVSATATTGLKFIGDSIAVTGSWTWTDTQSSSNSTSNSHGASLTVTGPSSSYTGPSDIAVYFDSIYGTFLFVPLSTTPALTGVVHDASGRPVAHQSVTLSVGGKQLHTVTRMDGSYRFFDAPAGAGQVTASNASMPVTIGATGTQATANPMVVSL